MADSFTFHGRTLRVGDRIGTATALAVPGGILADLERAGLRVVSLTRKRARPDVLAALLALLTGWLRALDAALAMWLSEPRDTDERGCWL